ncbi:HesB/IscA family protein [Sedimenticola hydrogenitrophicus]|uniref:HesB/IscA family protein n=1 Tax=Sedimenticola hydrogenitrophicus TaxID=2967975 RepID=UPI0023AEF394|nr:iron-sulfur cluster assembly accessory protein [Sedimenticola hydrogenitrophicus]
MGLFQREQSPEGVDFSHQIADQVRVTPEAKEQLVQLIQNEEDIVGIRIFIYGGGCGGMSYGLTFVEQPQDIDCVLEQDDLKIFVDPVALSFLEGVEVDYQTQGLNSSIVFRNVFQSIGGSGACNACGASGGGGGGCA